MKALFLDIDGVLNSSRSVLVKIGPNVATSEALRQLNQDVYPEGLPYGVTFGLKTVDPVCVALLNRLLEEAAPVALVLSSTHRKFLTDASTPYGSDAHMRRLREYLTIMGVQVPIVFSVTADLHRPRGEEVEAWLNMAYENGVYDDEDEYVILDDGRDFRADQPLVWCDPDHGFAFDNYAEACRMLGTNPPGLILL